MGRAGGYSGWSVRGPGALLGGWYRRLASRQEPSVRVEEAGSRAGRLWRGVWSLGGSRV